MGLFDFMRRRQHTPEAVGAPEAVDELQDNTRQRIDAATKTPVGAEKAAEEHIQTFDNSNITYGDSAAGIDIDSILHDKQGNIVTLYRLSDYFTDADALIHGIIHHVYKPYTLSSDWVLQNASEKTYKIYRDYYKQIHLKEKLDSIALEYWKYANVFVYILDGVPITLPVDKCKIGNVALNGEPIVDFDCQSVYTQWREKHYTITENWIKDNALETYFRGYPPEVQEALNRGAQYAQLNPKYCKVLQMPKEGWHRYAIPIIAACLTSLARKELIGKYETAILNLGIRSFVHVTYGDPKDDIRPDINQLKETRSIFAKAMSGFPLAVTNHLAKAEVIQPKADDLFQFDKYKDVNNDILSAGGVSGIIVSGVSEDGSTFASAQVSMETVAARIEAAREELCALMNKVNECIAEKLAETHVYNVSQIPTFSFTPLDMAGKKALREACLQLWEKGVVSTETMLTTQGYSIEEEKEKRKHEKSGGYDEILVPREISNQDYSNEGASDDEASDESPPGNSNTDDKETRGRKQLDNDERNSDPDSARRSKQPKPSNPEGSGDGGADDV